MVYGHQGTDISLMPVVHKDLEGCSETLSWKTIQKREASGLPFVIKKHQNCHTCHNDVATDACCIRVFREEENG